MRETAFHTVACLAIPIRNRARSGMIQTPQIHIAWRFGQQRLNHICRESVLTIDSIEVEEQFRSQGLLTEIIKEIRFGGSGIEDNVFYLHFKECGEGLCRLLKRLGLKEQNRGLARDFWIQITGQKELFDALGDQ